MWRTTGTKIGIACLIFLTVLLLAFVQPAYSAGLALDGSGSNSCASSSTCISSAFSTSNSNDVIIVFAVSTGSAFSGVPTASGLSFTVRLSTTFAGEWWALASTPLAAETVTVTTSSSLTNIGLVVWGISGANTASPFDPSLSSPATNSGSTFCFTIPCSVSISVTIPSTSNSNDMILGMAGVAGSDVFSAGSGFALIAGPSVAGAEYKVVSSTQSGLSVPMTLNNDHAGTAWVMFGDAVQAAPTTPIPEYPLGLPILAILTILAYGVIRRRTRN